MKYYQDLLESYQLLKQRKFKLTVNEARVNPQQGQGAVEQATEALFKASKTLAPGKQSPMNTPMGTAMLSLSKSGGVMISHPQIKGNIPIINAQGNINKFNINQVAALFGSEGGEQDPGQPQQQAQPGMPGDPNAQMQDPMMQMAVMDPLTAKVMGQDPAIRQNLMTAFSDFESLLNRGFFGKLASNAQWRSKSRMMNKFYGVEGSFEYKLANSKGVDYDFDDEALNAYVDLDDEQKVGISKIFMEGFKRCQKFYDNSFTQDDADWMRDHFLIDSRQGPKGEVKHNTIWIRDPVTQQYGAALSWGNEGVYTHFLISWLESYNKKYEQWAEENKESLVAPIQSIDLSKEILTKNANAYGRERGLVAEYGASLFLAISQKDKKSAVEAFTKMQSLVGDKILASIQALNDYKMGTALGNEDNLLIEQFFNEFDIKHFDKLQDAGTVINEIVKKFIPHYMVGTLGRAPASVINTGGNVGEGKKADLVENYHTPQRVGAKLKEYGLSDKDISEVLHINPMTGQATMRVSMKTDMARGDLAIANSSPEARMKSLKQQGQFIHNLYDELDPMTKASYEEVAGLTEKIDKAIENVKISMGPKNVSKLTGKQASAEVANVIKGIIKRNVPYDELDAVMKHLDLDNELHKQFTKQKIQRTIYMGNISKGLNHRDPAERKKWKTFVALAALSGGVAEEETLLEIFEMPSAYHPESSNIYTLNNKLVKNAVKTAFSTGSIDTINPKTNKKASTVIYFKDSEGRVMLKVKTQVKNNGAMTWTLTASKDYINTVGSRRAIKETKKLKENLILKQFIELQQNILNEMLTKLPS